eukprot:gene2666-4147_t
MGSCAAKPDSGKTGSNPPAKKGPAAISAPQGDREQSVKLANPTDQQPKSLDGPKDDTAEDATQNTSPNVPPALAIRQDILEMSDSAVDRFFDAVNQMMVNKAGPGTSEFFRCASYHGEPSPSYCHHGIESFPGWHRMYMKEFENALRAADIELGNDGDVSLPFWEWNSEEGSKGVPEVVRKRFTGWPEGFWPEDLKKEKYTRRLKRAEQQAIAQLITSTGVREQAVDCMRAHEHWAFASKKSGNLAPPSLEVPHDSIHVIVGGNGGQMGAVSWAAYDIVFWLHHSNIDRLYEAYLRLEPDSADEFANHQSTQETNRFTAPLEPFKKEDGSFFTAKDTFDTKALGYEYSRLPAESAATRSLRREPPTLVIFPDLRIHEFESKCYQVHVFLVGKDELPQWTCPKTARDINYASPNYAGGQGIFGRGSSCGNCVASPAYDMVIDVTKAVKRLGVSRYDVAPVVCLVETTSEDETVLQREDTPLPAPFIVGPLFEDLENDVDLESSNRDGAGLNEIKALQAYLQQFGYYDAPVDGIVGAITQQALVDFMNATGKLSADASTRKLTAQTKHIMATFKRCRNKDPFAENDIYDELSATDSRVYTDKTELTYHIGVQPGYLKRPLCEEAIAKAVATWADACKLSFEKVDTAEHADIVFKWVQFKSPDDVQRFDGVGGVLGRGGNGFVEFDLAERWVPGIPDSEPSRLLGT